LKKNLALAALALVLLLGAAQAQSPNSVPDQLKAIQAGISDLKAQSASLAEQNAALAAQNAALAAQNASLAAQVTSNGPRKFYLTKTEHKGDTALTACAAGYHMASMWEILDPTNLRYNKDLGVTREDSGSGPPTINSGWVRTGSVSGNNLNAAGLGNCNGWASASSSDGGTVVGLPTLWSPPPGGFSLSVVDPWVVGTSQCVVPRMAWCVQD
jgi:hypothetical protein